MTDQSTELVSILVPKQHLGRVYGFISTLDKEPALTEPDAAAESKEENKWTPELIRRQFVESPDSIKGFQTLLADHQGEWLSTSDIASRLGAERGAKSIAGALGAYGRRTSNRYKMTTWPFQHRWNHAEGQQYYSMQVPETADIIKSL
jgi:hypothetical protein